MDLVKQPQENLFDLSGLTFAQIKTIRDACKGYAKQGSAPAETIAREIEALLDNLAV